MAALAATTAAGASPGRAHADGLALRAAVGPVRTRVDVGRDEEPKGTGVSAEAGVGWGWRAAFVEIDGSIDRAAVVNDDMDLPVELLSQMGLGAALGYRGAYGVEVAATAAWAHVELGYRDDTYDYERSGWAFGARAAKTWPVAPHWAMGLELAAEIMLVEAQPLDAERPLVWTYRARFVVVQD